MPRKSKTAVEEGYVRSLWEECAEMEREQNVIVTLLATATTQRGVFSFRLQATEFMKEGEDEPRTWRIIKRLPDGGSLPFAGALWDMGRKLNDLVTEARQGETRAPVK